MHPSKTASLVGWLLTALIVLLLAVVSAGGKVAEWDGKEEMMAKLGYDIPLIERIAIVEVACALLLIPPPTAFLGAVLTTAYLGGAVATHVRIGDVFVFPILVGVVMWIAIGLRKPAIFRLALGGYPANASRE